jgi:hypothetical protein
MLDFMRDNAYPAALALLWVCCAAHTLRVVVLLPH